MGREGGRKGKEECMGGLSEISGIEGLFDVERKDREVAHQSYNLHPVFLAWLSFWPLEANDQAAKERSE